MEQEPIDPLAEICDVESDEPQFEHLGGMDGFVLKNHILPHPRQLRPFLLPDEDESEEIDSRETLEGNVLVLDYFHRISIVISSPLLYAASIFS